MERELKKNKGNEKEAAKVLKKEEIFGGLSSSTLVGHARTLETRSTIRPHYSVFYFEFLSITSTSHDDAFMSGCSASHFTSHPCLCLYGL
jgi:hypothetical protein